jgi:hypothetical protein
MWASDLWLKGATILGLSVRTTAPEVLPWKAPEKLIIPDFPVAKEASFNAFSLASAPELHRNKWKSG